MLTLDDLHSEHAIIQRDQPLEIRGKAKPGALVKTRWIDNAQETFANTKGEWSVVFPPCGAGGPYPFSVESEGQRLHRKDWMVGEVWLCSGQSNMEWTLAMTPGMEQEIAQAERPLVRCFTVPRIASGQPLTSTEGRWEVLSPETAGRVSAVAWFFARRLSERLDCPVGVLVSAFGGTRIASWLPQATLDSKPEYAPILAEIEEAQDPEQQPHKDLGRAKDTIGWESPEHDDTHWGTLEVPGMWQEQGWQLNGAVWYRRRISLPPEWRGRELLLNFGACDDFDETFVNGHRVGGLGLESAGAYSTPRHYPVPASLTEGGELLVAVRIFDEWGFGGIVRSASLNLAASPEDSLSLEGTWRARIELALALRTSARPIPPCVLFNGMIHPLRHLKIRGVLWYQGESDVERAAIYPLLLGDLIQAWRGIWKTPLLPFGIVQLANYKAVESEPGESDWAELREAQSKVARNTPGTGLAVAIDTGEADNIHPRLKKPVGERLALWAITQVYDHNEIPGGSPIAVEHWLEGDAICIRFTETGSGLRARDNSPLSSFQIAGADRLWRWADAEIIAPDVVRVRSLPIKSPVAVRYGWQNNPVCTLENSAGLPASPFQTAD
jgi:sialate O-acetylesterase